MTLAYRFFSPFLFFPLLFPDRVIALVGSSFPPRPSSVFSFRLVTRVQSYTLFPPPKNVRRLRLLMPPFGQPRSIRVLFFNGIIGRVEFSPSAPPINFIPVFFLYPPAAAFSPFFMFDDAQELAVFPLLPSFPFFSYLGCGDVQGNLDFFFILFN